jgi:hypothetical protein
VTAALYATIWIALTLFAIGEAGAGRLARRHQPATWAWGASMLGAAFAAVHVLIALAIQYNWDHDAAVAGTARQAAALYGFEWRGSIYVSYTFLLCWFAAAVFLRPRPAGNAALRWLMWLWRGFALIVIVNGAIVFTRPAWRPLGVALVAMMLWSWLPWLPPHPRGAGGTASPVGPSHQGAR